MENIGTYMSQKISEAEENVINQVLRTILNREANIEDYKKCTRIFEPHTFDKYTLSYDGYTLGWIEYVFPNPFSEDFKISVNFEPYKQKPIIDKI